MGVTMYEWKGAWWITVHHKGQRKRKRVGPGKEGHRAAKAAAEQIRARLALGDTSLLEDASRVPTFKDAAEQWLEAYLLSGQIRDATHAEYARALRLHGYPRLGSKPVTAITRADVRDLVIGLMSQGKSRSLARNLLAPIRQTFNQLIDDGVVTANPGARMGRYLKDRIDRRGTVDFLRPDEEARLLASAREHAPRYFCLLLCGVRTGLRIGELFGLQWDDLDFSGRFIEVRRTLKDGGRAYPPKNGKIRRVDMSLQLSDELKRHRVEYSREALAKGWGAQPWIFLSSEGAPLHKPNFVRRVFNPLLRKAGLRRIRPHALRHTFASRLLQNGESPAYVKEQMGHHSIKVTVDTYGHLIPGANKAAVDRLDTTGRHPHATEKSDEKKAL